MQDILELGVTNTRVRERLLREDNLNLEKSVKIYQAAEATEHQIQSLSTEKGASISNMNYCQNNGRRQNGKSQQKTATKCKSCDTMHAPRACPAYKKACNKCRKFGHFAVVCGTKTKPQRGKVRYVG